MKIKLSYVFYIVIVSSILGLLINFLRPDGISFFREEKQLLWADSVKLTKKVNSDSINVKPEKSHSNYSAGSLTDSN